MRALDARVTIFLGLAAGILTWHMATPGVAVLGVVLLLGLLLLGAGTFVEARLLRAYALFIGFWIAFKTALEALGGHLDRAAIEEISLLGLRLFVLLCLGLVITLMASPRALGLALAWYSRPIFGRRAWRAALALSLMVHFLPQAWRAADTVRASIARRCPELPWHRRARLLPQATIRVLAQSTWEQTLALAARDLDRAAAWETNPAWRPVDAAVALGGIGLLGALVLI